MTHIHNISVHAHKPLHIIKAITAIACSKQKETHLSRCTLSNKIWIVSSLFTGLIMQGFKTSVPDSSLKLFLLIMLSYIKLIILIPACVTLLITCKISVHLPLCLPVSLSTCVSAYLSLCLPVYLSLCLPVSLSICLCLPVSLLPVSLSTCLSVHLSLCLPISLSLSVYLPPCLSVYLSLCLAGLSIYMSVCLSVCLILYHKYNNTLLLLLKQAYFDWLTCLSSGYPETYNVVLMEMFDTHDCILCNC